MATDVALPAGTNNIGDVDVLTIPAPLSTTGGGTEATALRVTLANDSTGLVSVDDNSGSLTVDLVNQDDYDSGVGTDLMDMVGIAVSASGGHVAITGDVANGLDVDVTRLPALVAGTANIGDVDVLTVPAPLSTTGGGTEATALRVTIANDSTGLVSVDDNGGSLTVDVGTALPAGANNIGDVDVLTIAAGTNAIGNVGLIGRTTGGMSIFKSIDIDETEEEIKATAGQVFSISAFNHTAAPIYLKFYNATAAVVVVGTTVPDLTFTVPGNADSDGAGFIWNNTIGFAFGTAITVAATTLIGDADATAPAVNACSVMVGYV